MEISKGAVAQKENKKQFELGCCDGTKRHCRHMIRLFGGGSWTWISLKRWFNADLCVWDSTLELLRFLASLDHHLHRNSQLVKIFLFPLFWLVYTVITVLSHDSYLYTCRRHAVCLWFIHKELRLQSSFRLLPHRVRCLTSPHTHVVRESLPLKSNHNQTNPIYLDVVVFLSTFWAFFLFLFSLFFFCLEGEG